MHSPLHFALALLLCGALRTSAQPDRDVEGLATVADAGSATVPLARRLVDLVPQPERGLLALRTLALLPPEVLDDVVGPRRAAWEASLVRILVAEGEDARSAPALALLARDGRPTGVVECLATAPIARRLLLLRALRSARRPPEVLEALAQVEELEDALFDPLCATLAQLIARDPEAATRAVALVSDGVPGWRHSLLRALGALPPGSDLLEPAGPLILGALEGPWDEDDADRLTAALLAATRLRLPGVGPLLPTLAAEAPLSTRIAAVRALAALRPTDADWVGTLVDLLEDPAVSPTAHRALVRSTGLALPPTRQAWRVRSAPDEEGGGGNDRSLRVAPMSTRAATPGPSSTTFIIPAGVALVATLGGLARVRRREGRSRVALSRAATRVERLRALLDPAMATTLSEQSDELVWALRDALCEAAPSLAGSPDPGLETLRELVRLGRAVEPSPAAFEALKADLERLEQAPVAGLDDARRELCFLLLQRAYLAQDGRSLEGPARTRCEDLLARLEAEVERRAPAEGARTMDVAVAFPEAPARPERAEGEAEPEERTLDVESAFPELATAPTQAPEAVDATIDVAEAFADQDG